MYVASQTIFETMRVGLDYGEEGHWLVEDFQSTIRVFEATVDGVEKTRKRFSKNLSRVGVCRRPSFLYEGL